jgi:acetamidase/formamidase
MPPIQGSLRLMEVKPYDIQQGKALGLVDVIPMTAERQGALMDEAQSQAAELFDKSDERYHSQAIDSIERNIRSLLGLTGAVVEFVWPTPQTQIGP